jgi:hypothetical protein
MRVFRTTLVALSAAAVGGALAFSFAVAAPGRAPAARPAHAQLTARFRAEAREALLRDFRSPDTALWVRGARPNVVAGTMSAVETYNWAGYADWTTTSGVFTKVSGSWKVPKLTCTPEDRVTGSWVGIDGVMTSSVEQAGTAEQCFEDKALYYTWYELYPANPVTVGTTVAAGDSISASVTRSGTKYTFKLTDSTHTANSFTKTGTCAATTCLDESAEWVTERPSFASTGIVPEAQFPTVTFSKASETASGKTGSISAYSGNIYDITCVDSTATYDIVATSALTAGGATFTNTWKNSY